MKMTLLEMVQDIMNDMDFDYVNSIADTPDALQVATIIRTTYYDLFSLREWPHAKELATLNSSGDSDKPNYLQLPEKLYTLHWLKYNKKENISDKDSWSDVEFIDPKSFLDKVMSRDSSSSRVTEITDFSGTKLLIVNDRAPRWATTFDDEWLVFDAWDSGIEGTLQASKCQSMVTLEPTFTLSDTFIPDMPSKAFSYLLAEAKSVCFATLKQLPNAKEEQRSRRQRIRLAREKSRIGNYILDRPDWGR